MYTTKIALTAVARRWAEVHGVFPVSTGEVEVDTPCRSAAERMGLPLCVVPASRLREGEIQRLVPDHPAFVCFDELECIGEEEAATLLALVTHGCLQGVRLPRGTTIAGMLRMGKGDGWQDPSRTALAEHAVFLPATNPLEHIPTEQLLPRRLPMRKAMWIARLERSIALPREAVQAIVNGGIHPQYAPAVFDCLMSLRAARIERAVAFMRQEGPVAAWTLPVPALQVALLAIVELLPTVHFAAVTERLVGELHPMEVHETYARLYVDLADRLRTAGGTVDIFGGDSVQQVATCLDRLARRLALREG